MKLNGKVIAITGGGGGIGAEIARLFLDEGCSAAVCGRTQKVLDELREEIRGTGKDIFTKTADVRKLSDLEAFAKAVAETYGGIDIWVNCAAVEGYAPLIECTEELWDTVIDVNLTGTWRGAKVAAPYIEKRGGGSIINISSFCSIVPTAKDGVYSVSKAAVDSLTKVLAAELAPKNIRVNALLPGMTETKMTEEIVANIKDMLIEPISMQRLGNPGDIARGVLFLASDMGRYVDGHALVISGGKFIVQNPLDPWNNYQGGY